MPYVGFFKRLFSADYRAAVAAEAAGELELAAERYALAGQSDAAVRVHLARADRAASRKGEITALRDAFHWTNEEEFDADLRAKVQRRLGKALLAQARAEGVATARDRERVSEAAELLLAGGAYQDAGEAYESIDDDANAAAAYRSGGLVDKMEDALIREARRSESTRAESDAYADYEVAARGGDRDGAIRALRRAVESADQKTEYRRLLDELEARLIASGRVSLVARQRGRVTVFAGDRMLIGRDPLCDYVLRSGGVSRRHAEIAIDSSESGVTFHLADAGSRNGTKVGGMPLAGSIPLAETGGFELGDQCEVTYVVEQGPTRLTLRVETGLDQDNTLRAGIEGDVIDLRDLGVPLGIYFHNGRPMVQHPGTDIFLGPHKIAHGDIQLVHGDNLSVGGVEIEVL